MTQNNITPAELYQNALQSLDNAREEYRHKERYIDDLVAKVQQLEQSDTRLRSEFQEEIQRMRADYDLSIEALRIEIQGMKADYELSIEALRTEIQNGTIVAGKALIESGIIYLPGSKPSRPNPALPFYDFEKEEMSKTVPPESQERSDKFHVNFTKGFSITPKVILSLTQFDTGPGHITNGVRIRVCLIDGSITTAGFDGQLVTWSDSRVFSVIIHWLAYAE